MPLDDMSDEQLMLACRYGNRGAFALLFEKYRGTVFHFARRMCGDETVAEELSQEVFLKVAASADRYEPAARFRTWLFTIARNTCLNSFRRPVMAPLPASVADRRADDPAAALSRAEREARVEAAIARLPEPLREAFLLRFRHGMDYEEIAEVTRVPVSTARTHVHRARLRLAEDLQGLLGEEQ
jgi:RNA polymerase sigma-70 factor (ECF subfamily)